MGSHLVSLCLRENILIYHTGTMTSLAVMLLFTSAMSVMGRDIKRVVEDVKQDAGESQTEKRDVKGGHCEKLTVPMCVQEVTWSTTVYPVSVNGETLSRQAEAGMLAHQFFPLVRIQCS